MICFFFVSDSAFSDDVEKSTENSRKACKKTIRLKWPKLIVSKETTFFVKPLKEDGTVNYIQALNEYRKPKGLTPENNAAIVFWKAVGPRDHSKRYHEILKQQLSLEPLPAKGNYFVTSLGFIEQQVKSSRNENSPELKKVYRESLREEFAEFQKSPYKTINYPKVKEWYQQNKIPLETIEKGLDKTHFYSPYISFATDSPGEKPDQEIHLVESVDRPFIHFSRDIARLLLLKAMFQLQKGNSEKAFELLLKIHKLTSMMTHKSSVLEQYNANGDRRIAQQGELQLVLHGNLTKKQAIIFYEELATLKGPTGFAESINVHERVKYLDIFQQLERGRDVEGFMTSIFETEEAERFREPLLKFAFDQNNAIKQMNLLFDRVVAISSKSFLESREEANQFTKEDMQTRASLWGLQDFRNHELITFFKMIFMRDYYFSDLYFRLFRRQFHVSTYDRQAQDIARTYFEMSKLTFLLAAYKAENRHYPKTLKKLIPEYTKAIPNDLFSGKSLKYRSDGKNFLIYSIGRDEIDDGGISYSEGQKTYDYVVSSFGQIR